MQFNQDRDQPNRSRRKTRPELIVTGVLLLLALSTTTGCSSDAGADPRTTTTAGDCTAGYSPCIPPASDVDCAGGSGNGPAYVSGPVRVTGSDPYGLDRDGNGVGCES